jgi:SAM-dependent methyltransferase
MRVLNNYRWANCPLCGASNIHAVGEIDYRKPIMFSTLSIELERVPELYECKTCNSWFTQNVIPEKSAFEMYSQGESCNKWPRNLGFAEEKSTNITQRLNKYFHEGNRILDIGCNTGILLDYARTKRCITAGVEPSSASRDILNKKGHATFPSIESVSSNYNVITAFDLVEHLYDLPAFFKKVENLLVDDGVILLLTGDNQSISALLSKKNWWYLKAPEHIVFPSRYFLNSINGFKLVSIDKTYASVGYDRSSLLGIIQYIRKSFFLGGYDGLPSLGADHMLVSMRKGL